MGEWRYKPTILNFGTNGGEWSALSRWRFIPKETALDTHFHRRLGGLQSQSERYAKEKYLLPLLGIESRLLSRPAHRLVAIPTALSRLPPPPSLIVFSKSSERRICFFSGEPWSLMGGWK
jgi:hypothetical protein